MENSHKSYNNPGSWNSFESDGKRKIISETEVDTIKQVLGDSLVDMLPDEEIHNDNFETKLNPESVEAELVETEDYDPSEERDLTNEEVNEVLQLTSYEDNQLIPSQHNNQYGIAEYKEIDIVDTLHFALCGMQGDLFLFRGIHFARGQDRQHPPLPE